MFDQQFLAAYRAKKDPFTSLMARVVFITHYRRPGDADFTDAVARVVRASCELDPNVGREEAESLFDAVWHLRMQPPGRGWWTAGAEGVPAEARYNCWFTEVRGIEDLLWACRLLMLGGGMGFGLDTIDQLPAVARTDTPFGESKLSINCMWDHADFTDVNPDNRITGPEFVVEDSREGWCDVLHAVLQAAWADESITVDVDGVRPRGAPLRTFGGTASGPSPLVALLRSSWAVVRGAAGRKLNSVEVLDLCNLMGVSIAMGAKRRSAEIVLGSPDDTAFRAAKHDMAALSSHRYASNNSIAITSQEQLDNMDWRQLAHDVRTYGEPGVVNLYEMRKTDPGAAGVNACQPGFATVLTPEGVRTFDDIDVGSTIWSGERWTAVTRKWSTGIKPVRTYRTTFGTFVGTENHRVVEHGSKIEVRDAGRIDPSTGPTDYSALDPQDVMDGLVLGDGTYRSDARRSRPIFLVIGAKDGDYHHSEIAHLIWEHETGYGAMDWGVKTRFAELPLTYNREIPDMFRLGDSRRVRGFLRGLFTANGSVISDRVTLKASSKSVIVAAQEMLSSVGIRSYYTTSKAKSVKFPNGTYECKESYDLNITSDRKVFLDTIGFIQKYKMGKLVAACAVASPPSYRRSGEIHEVTELGDMPVYDITVDADEHTYWTGGVLVSNCSEIVMHHREACALSEVFPTRCSSDEEIERAVVLATRYVIRQRLTPVSDPQAEEVRQRNFRLGVSLSGIVDSGLDKRPAFLRRLYKLARTTADAYTAELGVNRPIAVTTVKPSGTLSLLASCSPGVNPRYAPYVVRNVRFDKDDPLLVGIRAAGVPVEPVHGNSRLVVASFVDKAPDGVPTTVTDSAEAQLERQLVLQQNWSDNSVSATTVFRDTDDLAALMARYIPQLKSTSFLPFFHGYAQAPYVPIDADEYARRAAAIDESADLFGAVVGDVPDVSECAGGSCPVRLNWWTVARNALNAAE